MTTFELMAQISRLAERASAVTPARVLIGRSGTSLPTGQALALRAAHAAARDAVVTPLDADVPALRALIDRDEILPVCSRASTREEYVRRPDLGRALSEQSRSLIAERCPAAMQLQVVIGDGLSPAAVRAQVPALLADLLNRAHERGWSTGRPILIEHARVGVINEIGDLLAPTVVVLLIGERPGLSSAESLSAYLAYRPRRGHTDADRNLIAGIHARGIPTGQTAPRILRYAEALIEARRSGVGVPEPIAEARPLAASARSITTRSAITQEGGDDEAL